jgi:inner membrane protein involved in colicin E2 resistance
VPNLNPLLAKILLIALLTLVLLLPLSRVESLIAERASLRDGAVERVANGVGRAQSTGTCCKSIGITRSSGRITA